MGLFYLYIYTSMYMQQESILYVYRKSKSYEILGSDESLILYDVSDKCHVPVFKV